MSTPPLIRLLSKVQLTTDCWLWNGCRDRDGYGQFRMGGRGVPKMMAHRAAYTLLRGPIPAGLTLDHLCRTRNCVNPMHLEPVTLAENVARGDTVTTRNRAKTECIRGHPFDDGNTYRRKDGSRTCRTCVRERAKC